MSSSVSPSYSTPGEAVASIEGPRSLIMSFAHNPTLETCSRVNTLFKRIVRYEFQEREKLQEIQEKREEKDRVLKEKIRILETLRKLAEEQQFELPPVEGDIDTQYATALTFIRAHRAQLIDLDILRLFLYIDFTDGINLFFEPGFNLSRDQINTLFGNAVLQQRLDVINRLLEQPAILSNVTIQLSLEEILASLYKPKSLEILLSMILSCGDRFTKEQFFNILSPCAKYNEIKIIRILLFGLTKERILSGDRNQNLILIKIAEIAAQHGSVDVLHAVFELEDRMPNDPEENYFQTAYLEAIKAGFSEAVVLLTPYLKGGDYRELLMFELEWSIGAGKLAVTRNLLNHIKQFKKPELENLLYLAAKSGYTEVLQEIIPRFRDQISQEWVKSTIQDRIQYSPLPIIRMLLSLLQRLNPVEDDVFADRALSKALRRVVVSSDQKKEQDAIINMLLRVGRSVFTVEFLRKVRDSRFIPDAPRENLNIIIDHLRDRQNAYLQELYDAALEKGDDKMAHELMLEYRANN